MNGDNQLISTGQQKIEPENGFGDNADSLRQKVKRPMQISWRDITIQAMPPKGRCKPKNALTEPKDIIRGVSGTVMPGQFLAIIGASGAGKTTLLNFLSGREISQNLEKLGNITVNGQDTRQIRNFSSLSAYVQQDDILFQTMTVRECLEFAAKLKLPGTLPMKIARVNKLIHDLKLTKCANTRIGGPLVKGVSGGERKRTSIGVELITDPSLIFLDEPTTGLDSFTATNVMEILGDLARKDGRTVISTIHQPNSDIFEMFDRLMLLARGKIIYFNEARLSVDYFKDKCGETCPDLSNPADFFMTMMSIESIELEEQAPQGGGGHVNKEKIALDYEAKIENFVSTYERSDLVNDHMAIAPGCEELDNGADNQGSVQTSFFYQFGLLCKRNFLNLLRLPQTSYVKLLTTCLTALFAILLFFNTQPNKAGIQNVQGSLFFITMNISFNAIQNVILIFPDERPVFLREVNNNMYNTSPYFWAKVISELPFSIMTPVIFGCIVYYAIGYNPTAEAFLIFLTILVLIYNASSGYSLIISASFSDKQLAVTLTPVLIIPFMLFAGFFVSSDNIPIFLKEFEYLSIFKYGYESLMHNQFDSYQEDVDTFMALPAADQTQANRDKYCHYPCWCLTGPEACDPFSQIASNSERSTSMAALAAIYVGCYLIAWFILGRLSNKYE